VRREEAEERRDYRVVEREERRKEREGRGGKSRGERVLIFY
jgi:hypothetical protein